MSIRQDAVNYAVSLSCKRNCSSEGAREIYEKILDALGWDVTLNILGTTEEDKEKEFFIFQIEFDREINRKREKGRKNFIKRFHGHDKNKLSDE